MSEREVVHLRIGAVNVDLAKLAADRIFDLQEALARLISSAERRSFDPQTLRLAKEALTGTGERKPWTEADVMGAIYGVRECYIPSWQQDLIRLLIGKVSLGEGIIPLTHVCAEDSQAPRSGVN